MVPQREREKYLKTCVPLSQACIKGDWRSVAAILDKNPDIINQPISGIRSTIFHLSVAFSHKKLLKKLFKKTELDIENLNKEDALGTKPFCLAAITGNMEILKMLVLKSPSTLLRKGFRNLFPVELAARCGHLQAASFLYEKTRESFLELTDIDQGSIFLSFTDSEMFDLALDILEKNRGVATYVDSEKHSALFKMALKPHAIGRHTELRWYERAFSKAKLKAQGRKLLEEVWSTVITLPEEDLLNHLSTPCSMISEAARMGNLEFLITLFRTYPDLIFSHDENEQPLYHIAAAWRHEDIFKTIYQLGAMKQYFVSRIDKQQNNSLLHTVASTARGERLSSVSGPALQMQHELLWFKAVEELLPRQFQFLKNEDNLSPHEVFVRDHKVLKEQGERWLKETSTSCMVVAALITTVIFATVFTLPGGTDEDTGLPKLGQRSSFAVFAISSGVGFSFSLASLLVFLSIITSRYNEKSFTAILPLKLMCAMISLYISIISMVLSFVAALFLVRGRSPPWRMWFIATLGILTALAYITVHGKLWFFTFCSAWKSNRLFSRKGTRNLFH